MHCRARSWSAASAAVMTSWSPSSPRRFRPHWHKTGWNFPLGLGVRTGSLFRPSLLLVSQADPRPDASPPAARPLSLGVIFLTLYIDIVGFSIGFPLGP